MGNRNTVHRKWRQLFLGLGLALLFSTSVRAALPEYQVKAAIIYKVARFVIWPEETGATNDLAFCVLGKDPFGPALDALSDKQLAGHTVAPRRLGAGPVSTDGCDIVFVAASESRRLSAILAQLAKKPILTISDIPNFADQGGMVGLVTRDNRIAFEINSAAYRRGGLEISSQLLQLATLLGEEG